MYMSGWTRWSRKQYKVVQMYVHSRKKDRDLFTYCCGKTDSSVDFPLIEEWVCLLT